MNAWPLLFSLGHSGPSWNGPSSSYCHFARTNLKCSFLPLYSGPQVIIRLAPTNREYRLSKALLCEQSPTFKAAFEGSFVESQEQMMTLNEEDGVISTQSFELLVQWMYTGQVVFGDLSPSESVAAALELLRIADFLGATGMEDRMAEHIKTLINGSSVPYDYDFDSNTYLIGSDLIASAVRLPHGHPVRKTLAAASVRGYLKGDGYRFAKEAKEIPGFSSDLLDAVRSALNTLRKGSFEVSVTDPISGQQIWLK